MNVLAISHEPVDWIVAAAMCAVGLVCLLRLREGDIIRDPWREAVLLARARAHGAKVRARHRYVAAAARAFRRNPVRPDR